MEGIRSLQQTGLVRLRLVRAIRATPSVLVAAPAGSGKSTAVAHAFRSDPGLLWINSSSIQPSREDLYTTIVSRSDGLATYVDDTLRLDGGQPLSIVIDETERLSTTSAVTAILDLIRGIHGDHRVVVIARPGPTAEIIGLSDLIARTVTWG